MNTKLTNTSLPALLLAGLTLIACSSADETSGDDSGGTGGVFASGGAGSGTGGFATGGSAAATGGAVASGGASLTGGAPTTGGTAASGGSSATGGDVGTGGELATGGTLSTGGTAPSGGTSSTGGSVSTGGSGGASSTGGTSSGGSSSGGASSGGASSGGSGSGSCTATQYVAGTTYVAGQRVSNDGQEYECKPYPYTGWCAGAAFAYEPGSGSAWADAWTLIGACDAGGTGGSASTGGAANTGGTSSGGTSSGGTSSGGTSSGGSTGSGGTSGGEPTAQQLLDKVNGCAASATNIKGGFGLDGAGAISMYSCDGAVYWKADLDVDCDGIQTPPCDTDPQGQPITSIEYLAPNGDVDPTLLPYIVIPLGSSEDAWYEAYGIHLGQVGAVIYNGQVRYGIFADEAGGSFIGEASYAMCQLFLGTPSGNSDPCDPSNGGIDPANVTYVTFTGTANQAKGTDIYDHAKHTAMGVAAADAWIATP